MLEEEYLSSSFFDGSENPLALKLNDDVSQTLSNSLFSEPLDMGIGNPWDRPAGGVDVGSILSDVSLPEIYAQAFAYGGPVGGTVTISTLNRVLSLSGLPHATVEKILNLAVPATSTHVNRGEFNAALALVGLAQKNMDVSIDNLIARREDLPEPSLPNVESLSYNSRTLSLSSRPQQPPAPAIEADPWAAPAPTNGLSDSPYGTVTEAAAPNSYANDTFVRREEFRWYLNHREQITVNFASEREGFLFMKHVNYIVECSLRSTRVIRRYSDFWWLMECLVKKYPFRILPALPPKKIGVDEAFLEKRRKGLARFLNYIARHPVLRHDVLFEMFISEQTEIAVWRKNNTPDLTEEFIKKRVPPELERRIPDDLDSKLEKVSKRIDASIGHYRHLCSLLERMARRREGLASDLSRYSMTLNALVENERTCYIDDCYPCTQVTYGMEQVSSHLQRASILLEEEASMLLENVLEGLKRHRDLLEVLERKDRLSVDNTETLNDRIAANQAKLSTEPGKENANVDTEQISASIQKDQEDVEVLRQRSVFVRHCLNTELTLFHKSAAFVSLLYQNFANHQIKYAQQLHENWKALSPKVYEMPIDMDLAEA
ncbi:7661_t:CDS:10 [Paraglomus occultum]|uniref:Sorting nexin MVP1 n=1 Tax=Paraglomus occultum TaxID=144539 RepID=A0A9N9FKA1_9GLOM|nr:7661_t:CDS:10 [Paraglomus occultum]